MRGMLLSPDFLPATARLAARAGLSLPDFISALWAGDACEGRAKLQAVLQGGLLSTDDDEAYAAEALLGIGPSASGGPCVAMPLRSLGQEQLHRFIVPGAVVLGVRRRQLRPAPAGMGVIILGDSSVAEHEDGVAEGDIVDVVICEVAYHASPGVTGVTPSLDADPAEHPRGSPSALKVEIVHCPRACLGDEEAVASAGAWAEAICRRYAACVFVAPHRHQEIAKLLTEVNASPMSLSPRSGAARGRLVAVLVRMAQGLQGPRGQLCLSAAAAFDAPLLLLLEGRDDVPSGSLACGATVERSVGGGVILGLGTATGEKRQRTVLLKRQRLPRSRHQSQFPSEGAVLACLLLRRQDGEPGPHNEPVPSFVGSSSRELDDLLAQQVGLRILTVPIVDGRPSRARTCKSLAEACGDSLRVEVSSDGSSAQVVGTLAEVSAAEAVLRSLRSCEVQVPQRVAWRVIGKGGSAVRQLEQDSGASMHVDTSRDPPVVEIFGEGTAVSSAEALLKERHAHEQLRLPRAAAPRVIGRNGAIIRDIEAQSQGASVHVETSTEECIVQVIGDAVSVRAALALLRQRVDGFMQVEVPRHLVQQLIGRSGAARRALEAESGASISVHSDRDPAIFEASGTSSAVTRARELLEDILNKNHRDSLEVPRAAVAHVAGRGGVALRQIEAATGAQVRAGDARRDPFVLEVLGHRSQVDAAMEALKRRANPSRRRVEVPRQTLAHIVGRSGAGFVEIEAATNSWLQVEEPDASGMCVVQAVGDQLQVERAEEMLRARAEVDSIVVHGDLLHCLDEFAVRAIQMNTNTVIHVPQADVEQPARVDIVGSPQARAAAKARIQAMCGASSSQSPPDPILPDEGSPRIVLPAPGELAPAKAEELPSDHPASRQLPSRLTVEPHAAAAGLPWSWTLPLDVDSPKRAPATSVGLLASRRRHGSAEAGGAKPIRAPMERASLPSRLEKPSDVGVDGTPRGQPDGCTPTSAEKSHREQQKPETLRRHRASLPPGLLEKRAGELCLFTGKEIPSCLKTASMAPVPWAWTLPPVGLHSPPRSLSPAIDVERPARRRVFKGPSKDTSGVDLADSVRADAAAAKEVSVAGNAEVCVEPGQRGDESSSSSAAAVRLPEAPASSPLREAVHRRLSWSGSIVPNARAGLPWSWRLPLELGSPCPARKRRAASMEPSNKVSTASQRALPSLDIIGALRGASSSSRSGERGKMQVVLGASRANESDVSTEAVGLDSTASCTSGSPQRPDLAGVESAPCELLRPPALQSSASKRREASPPLFAAAGPAAWAALPTPSRSSGGAAAGDRSRSRSRVCSHRRGSRRTLYLLDGLNILRHRNCSASSVSDVALDWDQLEVACRYYTSRGCQVSVYLPPLRDRCEQPRIERLCEEFGDIFVVCKGLSAADDKFMINTAKCMNEDAATDGIDTDANGHETPPCCIVTNDRFEDWRQRGDVDSAWVERHCVRFAFGPGGRFVPSELVQFAMHDAVS